MTNETQRDELIHALICGLVDNERAVELDCRAMPSRVDWRCKVDLNDMGKVIGRQASHIKAMKVMVSLMGRRYAEDWRFVVVDPPEGKRGRDVIIPNATEYDEAGAVAFLRELLGAMIDETPAIAITKQQGSGVLTYGFKVCPQSYADTARMLDPVQVTKFETLAPIAALGTLWRAYGRQEGCIFTIELA
jgi:predicted RNA-binding protein YlqC (UPF0109 family)